MKILLPFKKDQNPYLDELIIHSKHTYVYDNFRNYDTTFKIVNIHWPEALFEWYEPTSENLRELEENIKNWKKNSFIVYTKHDEVRHKKMTPNFQRLFALIEENTDLYIHLGSYSKNLYEKKYPKAQHKIVNHPLYQNSFEPYKKPIARRLLKISQNAFVVTVPGKIRNRKERKLVLNSFKFLPEKDKVLIATNMRKDSEIHFPGRIRLKKIFDIKKYRETQFIEKYQPPSYLFNYGQLARDEFALRISAADIIFVPRINIWNSGNVFLAYTFKKIVVGPATGNIEEHLINMGMPIFNPDSIDDVVKAIEEGRKLQESGYYPNDSMLEEFSPSVLSKKLDQIFENLVS